MIIELLMKLDVILKNVGCTVTKMLDQNMDKVTDGTNDYPLKPKADKGAKKNEGLPPWIV